MAFVFYDTETTGISTGFDQILQFAAVMTDDELNQLDQIELRCRLHPHVVPHPGALAVTGMTIDNLLDAALPCHYEMVREIREKLIQWSPATFIGYNSLRFDEELLRKALFRTLHPAYLTNTGGNTRADAMVLIQVASVFAPDCLTVPVGEKGHIFKLDQVAPLNGFNHINAHDALGDVFATIHLAKCVKQRSPEVWDRFLRYSTKASAQSCLYNEDAVLLTEFYFNKPYQFVVSAIGPEPGNSAAILALDLSHDIDWIASLPDDQLATWIGQNPKKIRRVRTNAAPSLATMAEVSDHMLGSLSREEIVRKVARLRSDPALGVRLVEAYVANASGYDDSPYIEEQIYSGGFVSNSDQTLMERFHAVHWDERAAVVAQFQDARLRHHGLLLLYENYTEGLTPEQLQDVEALIWDRLMLERAPKNTWTSLHHALADTEEMLVKASGATLQILSGLKAHLESRIHVGAGRI